MKYLRKNMKKKLSTIAAINIAAACLSACSTSLEPTGDAVFSDFSYSGNDVVWNVEID